MITANSIQIDTDEGRYVLHIETEELGTARVDIHDIVLDFYASVKENIGPYAAEAESARQAVASGMSRADYLEYDYVRSNRTAQVPQPVTSRPVDVQDAIDAGYALDDPKSPGFHDRMVD